MILLPAVTGFLTGGSLIFAFGAQNAFVLRHGLRRTHVFWICFVCAVSDLILIAAGVAGFSAMIAAFPAFPIVMTTIGATFLIAYGLGRLWAAWVGVYDLSLTGTERGLTQTLWATLAFTWLNPHVYLDTLGLIGAISTQYDGLTSRISFGVGAGAASVLFFFALGYGARLLAPVMTSVRAWRILDIVIGLTMCVLAAGLLARL